MNEDSTNMPTAAEWSRYTDPDLAVDHVRRVARETVEKAGYRAAAFAVMALRQAYRIMPLKQQEAPPDRLATWQAVRMETRSLVSMASGSTAEHALFDERSATPAGRPLPRTRVGHPTLRRPCNPLLPFAPTDQMAVANRQAPLPAPPKLRDREMGR